ncbi:phosphonate transport system ATP-binding protein [Tistlia consotensis]|uniref:Phosphonate transport system ATP-binding protein n=1 Tax=Tistlia consotensis USBA 355 TaxID=560819 RepID=A0A1Y6CMG2_9PROT|nr:phosphonate ABC transporter ATP-binding protein [Tistlia consotensis]SMF77605.1 phosphonate transport system ATP-binding protein [Tistlia consotensis USBA 355]SNS21065.1 phosphonate transport system ATP-binding protein [Tistlia consotensis]
MAGAGAGPGGETLLRVRGLRMRFAGGTAALDGVDLSVGPGELVIVLGSNGSGKSTLLRCISRLLHPTGGEILVAGQNLSRLEGAALRRARQALGMIFQHGNLVRRRSVLANVVSGSLGRHPGIRTSLGLLPAGEVPAALGYLREVGLEHLAQRRASTLSGGQAQRVAIARALAQRPRLLLADEPVASLDPEAAEEIMRLLRRLAKEDGLGVLCVLHQPELAVRYADRIVGLQHGRVLFDQPAGELAEAPIDRLYEAKTQAQAA